MGLCVVKFEMKRMVLWFGFMREVKLQNYDLVRIIVKDYSLKFNNFCYLFLLEDFREFYEKLQIKNLERVVCNLQFKKEVLKFFGMF